MPDGANLARRGLLKRFPGTIRAFEERKEKDAGTEAQERDEARQAE